MFITSKFEYNFYEKNEALTSDDIINNKNNTYNSKEIKIKIEFQNYDFLSNKNNEYRENLNLDKLKSLNNKTLSSKEISFFNGSSKRKNFLEKNYAFNNIEDISNSFNINFLDLNISNRFLKNKKIQIDEDKIESINKDNDTNMFFSKNLTETYDFKDQDEEDGFSDSIKIYNGYTPYNTRTIYGRAVTPYYTHIGFFVQKYSYNNKDIILHDNRFFLNKINNNNQFIEVNENTVFRDINVKYGSKYVYRVFPVFSVSIPRYKDFHLIDDYLVCDIPYVSDKIICKEKVSPKPPVNLKFIKNKNKLKIIWSKSPDYQNDVKGFQIFKRYSLDEPFRLVKQIEYHLETDFYERNNKINLDDIVKKQEIDANEFIDDIEFGKPTIYTICAIDAHGLVSNYSSQIACLCNKNSDAVDIDLVSQPGAPLFLPNLFIKRKTRFFSNEDKFVTITPSANNISKFTIYATPDFHSINKNSGSNVSLYKENYKINIFKLENNENFIDNIKIVNFNN